MRNCAKWEDESENVFTDAEVAISAIRRAGYVYSPCNRLFSDDCGMCGCVMSAVVVSLFIYY